MKIQLAVGGGKTAEIDEPTRAEFPGNLGGAVEYTLAHMVFTVLRVMGAGLGEFLAGFLVRFLERIEPTCVVYMRPLLDMLLGVPELPSDFRTFLVELRTPKHEVGGAILASLGSTVTGAVVGSLMGSLMAGPTYALNRKIRPGRPTAAEAYHMYWRGAISLSELRAHLSDVGYPDSVLDGFAEVLRPRMEMGTLLELYRRGTVTWGHVEQELVKAGYTLPDVNRVQGLVNVVLEPERVIQAWWRKTLTTDEAVKRLKTAGYSEADAKMLLDLSLWIPGASDLIHMGVREAFRDDVAARFGYDEDFPAEFGKWLERVGGSADWAKRYWRAHWTLPSVQMGYEMMHRGIIDEDTLTLLLKVSDIPKFWRDKLVAMSYSPLTRVDVRRMYGMGVLTREDVKRSYLDLGYSELNAERMTEFTVRYEAGDEGDTNAKNREITSSLVLKGYQKGVYNRTEAYSRLLGLRYLPEDAEFLLTLEDTKRVVDNIPDPLPEYQRDIKAMVERGYSMGYLEIGEAVGMLGNIGYTAEQAGLILAGAEYARVKGETEDRIKIIQQGYVSRAITRSDVVQALGELNIAAAQQDRYLAAWDIQRNVRTRRLSEAQYRKAMQMGLITKEAYCENLRGLEYTEYDIALLVKMATGE